MRRVGLGALLCLLLLGGCLDTGPDRTADVYSREFADKAEKLEFLEEYLVCPTEVLDAEYHILYYDNGTFPVPGPSDWVIAAALRVDPAEADAWLDGMIPAEEAAMDPQWWAELPLEDWPLAELPEPYRRETGGSYLLLYRQEGIILKYLYTT